jgi:glucan phosphorylase
MGSEMASDSRTSARRPNALIRTGLGADAIATALIENLHCLQGKLPRHATRNDWYMALAYAVRDRMMERYVAAVAELMRLLVDEHAIEEAWTITQKTCGYTNHTLLAEALERWPLALFAKLLPRHLEIIYEINRRFLDDLRLRYPNDDQLLRRLSLIDEAGDKYIRMSHLASVGSHAINGVAALHTELLKRTVLRDFHRVSPEKFFNVTNGVTPRRLIALSNPKLSASLPGTSVTDGWRIWKTRSGASSRSPMTSIFGGTGKPSRPITNGFWPVLSRSEPTLL